MRGQVPGLSAPTHLEQLARFLLRAAAMPPVASLGVSSSSSRPRLWSQLLGLGGEGAGSIAGGPQAAMLVQDLGGGACPSHRQHQQQRFTRQVFRGSTLKPLNLNPSATAAGGSTGIRTIAAGTSTASQVGAGSVGTINPTSNSTTTVIPPLPVDEAVPWAPPPNAMEQEDHRAMPWDARGLPVGCRASRLSLLEPGSSLPRSLTSRFHQLRTDHHTAACALHRKGLGFRV